MTSKEIRDTFLKFFESKSHKIVPSAPVVIKNDPTLMFTNAGMNQFKDLFLGEKTPEHLRVVDTQKCLRVSGKHNDLEEVGMDHYHHTFFEMLGNWSFGDYFKKEAIAWAWELLTEVYQLDKDRLYVTVFGGDAAEGLAMDQEAYDFWLQHVPKERILMGSKKDNFWEMGEMGPCGPCSEIHFDMRTDQERRELPGDKLVNEDHEQVIEVWNLVFMQFNRLQSGKLESLPAKHVDTGMGLERLVRAIQKKTSNYDTDLFVPLIEFIEKESGKTYGDNLQDDIAMRVLADHIRAVCFTIADGQLPSNNKAGYVIRRILRRAVRYAYTFLGFKEAFFYKLTPLLAEQYKGVFDELYEQKDFVEKVIYEEELSFLKTLTVGIERFESYASSHKAVDGAFAFELFDTYGFPIDLTQLLASEKGLEVDMDGFEKALLQQKERSRSAATIETGDWIAVHEEDEVQFVGYDTLEVETEIIKYRKVVDRKKEVYQAVLAATPFYAEGGGQVGDKGLLISSDNQKVKILDTKRENGVIVHYLERLPSPLEGRFLAKVDAAKRLDAESNHSATHLLHAALRQVLGDHVQQRGSLVSADLLRFDFSHFEKVSYEQLKEIEDIVLQKIRQNIPLFEQRSIPYKEAIDQGVTALFGEKYGDQVRVITFDGDFSKELCGGTHVGATGQIGFFKITSESSVAAGVRRIEAITGSKAQSVIREHFELVDHLKELMNKPKDFVAALNKVLHENSGLKKEIGDLILQKARQLQKELEGRLEEVNGVSFLATKVDLPDNDAVKTLAFSLRAKYPRLFLLLATEINDKPGLTLMISDELIKENNWNASQVIRELAKHIQGGGGGQPFVATAGGKNKAGIPAAIHAAREWLENA